ncbi:MAG TPA: cytochrome c [Tepidisphaeraceae bacterium]|jgi:mono/diheme cytochrome c family protein
MKYFLTFTILCITVGCGSARREQPLGARNPALDDPKLAQGKILFDQNCYQCHPGGATGLGPALNNKPAPAAAIKTQVRAGLGAMPKFTKEELSDDQLDQLVAYVKALRKA